MARNLLIMLYVFNVLIALVLLGMSLVNNFIFFIIMGILLVIWFFTYIFLSIKNIININKLIKHSEKQKLKKMAESVKLYSIPFWVINFISLFIITFATVMGTRGILIFLVPVPIFITYIILLGTSVFSISYIKILYKENDIKNRQMIMHIILQLLFFWDIADIIYLKIKVNKKIYGRYNGL